MVFTLLLVTLTGIFKLAKYQLWKGSPLGFTITHVALDGALHI